MCVGCDVLKFSMLKEVVSVMYSPCYHLPSVVPFACLVWKLQFLYCVYIDFSSHESVCASREVPPHHLVQVCCAFAIHYRCMVPGFKSFYITFSLQGIILLSKLPALELEQE